MLEIIFWTTLGLIAWTHVLYPLAAGLAARLFTRKVAKGDWEPTVTIVVAAHNEEAADRAAAREPARARLSGREAGDRGRLRRIRPTARTSWSAPSAGDPRVSCSPARAAARSPPRTARSRERGRGRRVLRCQRHLGARRAPQARRATSPTRRSPTSAGGSSSRRADGSNQEGVYWRYELGCARRSRGWARSPPATARSTRSAGPTTWTSTRASDTTSRSRTSWCSAAAARSTSRRRARREADPVERGRVPAQGAHVRAQLADHAARLDALPLTARLLVAVVSHRLLRYGSGPLHLLLLGLSIALVAIASELRLRARARPPAGRAARGRARASPSPRYYVLITWATLVSLWNYLRRGVRHLGRRRGNRDEPRRRRRDRRLRARRVEPGARAGGAGDQARRSRARSLPPAARRARTGWISTC